jgi:hypothetical protein
MEAMGDVFGSRKFPFIISWFLPCEIFIYNIHGITSDGHDTEKKYLDTIPILQILTILYLILYYTVW